MKGMGCVLLCMAIALASAVVLPAQETARADMGYSTVITSGYTYTIRNVKRQLPLAVCGGSSAAGENVIMASDTSGLG